MNRNQRLEKLFGEIFVPETNFRERGKARAFNCPDKEDCQVDEAKEPIWSPFFGDETCTIMLVAEAPSLGGKKNAGPHIGGLFDELEIRDGYGLKLLREFAKELGGGKCPHFTDLMKCGVSAQDNKSKNEKFGCRRQKCLERFLLREIEIINPKIILCVGKVSFDAVSQVRDRIPQSVEIYQLLHYGAQANLPLSAEEKKSIIWPIQVGQKGKEALADLAYLNAEGRAQKKLARLKAQVANLKAQEAKLKAKLGK